MLGGVSAYMIPRCLRSNEDMHLDLNARIAVNRTEGNSVYFALVYPTESCPAALAEAKPPSGRRLILGQVLFPVHPRERVRCDLRVGRTGTAEGLSTSRAVTASTAAERCSDSVTDATAKTAAGQGHHFSPYGIFYAAITG
jgi:hypothetical protein